MNPNNSRPMSYDSLKTLLQHAKPNLRFELSRRIPSIYLTEKAVPLRVDKLSIGKYGVEVNDDMYGARVKRHFTPDDPDLRGYSFDYTFPDGDWDMDEWGFNDFSSETVITPGDLVFRVEGHAPRHVDRSEQRMKTLENGLKFLEWMVAKKSGEKVEPNWTGDDIPAYFKTSCEKSSLIQLKCGVVQYKIDVAPFQCFLKNIPLPFTKTVQVAFGSRNSNLNWSYTGNLKFYEIRKKLMTWLLGDRKYVINVNHLIVINGIIARLPGNLRISVKTLEIQNPLSYRIPANTNTMLNKLEAIIHNNNCPLEVFEIDKLDEGLNHPLAANAKKLIVSQRWLHFPNANRLIRIPNQKLHISTSRSFNLEEIIRLIRNWKENPREIGKCLSFEGSEWAVKNAVKQIQATFDRVKRRLSIKIPVNNLSKISVSYGKEVLWRWDLRLRLMTIEVVAA